MEIKQEVCVRESGTFRSEDCPARRISLGVNITSSQVDVWDLPKTGAGGILGSKLLVKKQQKHVEGDAYLHIQTRLCPVVAVGSATPATRETITLNIYLYIMLYISVKNTDEGRGNLFHVLFLCK